MGAYREYKKCLYYGNDENPYALLYEANPDIVDLEVHPETKSILNGACKNHAKLKTVDFPNGLIQICEGAFDGCSNLTSIHLPSSIRDVQQNAFNNCNSLHTITADAHISAEFISAFSNCPNLKQIDFIDNSSSKRFIDVFDYERNDSFVAKYKSIESEFKAEIYDIAADRLISYIGTSEKPTIPDNVTKIGSCAFSNKNAIKNIVIPDHIEQLYPTSFNGCENLETVHIGQNVWDIGYATFGRCPNLKNITVNENNEFFHSVNGVLYDNGHLIKYPPAKENFEVVIQKGTIAIEEGAFVDAVNLRHVIVPEGVIRIGSCAFSGCDNLNTIELPQSLKLIESGAFSGCTQLEEIKLPQFIEVESLSPDLSPFSGCDNLKRVIVGDKILEINGPEDLAALPQKIQELQYSDFIVNNNVLEEYWGSDKTVLIPKDVKVIGDHAFAENDSVTKIVIPNSVTYVDATAFENCKNLEQIEAPQHLLRNIYENNPNVVVINNSDIQEITINQNPIIMHDLSDLMYNAQALVVNDTLVNIDESLHGKLIVDVEVKDIEPGALKNSKIDTVVASDDLEDAVVREGKAFERLMENMNSIDKQMEDLVLD